MQSVLHGDIYDYPECPGGAITILYPGGYPSGG